MFARYKVDVFLFHLDLNVYSECFREIKALAYRNFAIDRIRLDCRQNRIVRFNGYATKLAVNIRRNNFPNAIYTVETIFIILNTW